MKLTCLLKRFSAASVITIDATRVVTKIATNAIAPMAGHIHSCGAQSTTPTIATADPTDQRPTFFMAW